MKKKILLVFLLGLMLISCDGNGGSDYDRGYDDGYDGASPRKSSSSYMSGYRDGQFDEECDYYQRNNLWDKYKNMNC